MNKKPFMMLYILAILIATLNYTFAAISGKSDPPLFIIEENGKFGFIDVTGKIVIEPVYDKVEPFSDGLACVLNEEGNVTKKWGYIDKTGKYVIEPHWRILKNSDSAFRENMAVVRYEARYALIDKSGELICEPIFSA